MTQKFVKSKEKRAKELFRKLDQDSYRLVLNMVYSDWNMSPIVFDREVVDLYETKYKEFFNSKLKDYIDDCYLSIVFNNDEEIFSIEDEVKRLKKMYNRNNLICIAKEFEAWEGDAYLKAKMAEFEQWILKK